MLERTTSAELLSQVFDRLRKTLSPSNNTLFTGWSAVLGGPGLGEYDVLENLALISAGLRKVAQQVNESKRLREGTKKSALQTIAELQNLLQFQHLNQNGNPLARYCSEKICGDLDLLGHALRPEFSEPVLLEADAQDITIALREVQELLKSSSIPLDLRVNLEKLLNAMLWWLEHHDITSAQDLFESIASAMAISTQISRKVEDSDVALQEAAQSIGKKLWKAAGILGRIIGFSAKNADGFEKLVHIGEEVSKQIS